MNGPVRPNPGRRFGEVFFALVPALALSVAIPWANQFGAKIAGLPFIMAWIIAWMLLTPLCLWMADRLSAWR